ncbi:MAG: NrpR regulatory domain-containing protein [Methanobrevibacter sp.]|nr:NrpR regulatory domain-containing protein [Methanobrevibacter sp.]
MTESQEKIMEILRILNKQEKAIGAKVIADELIDKGYELGERAVRYHMQILDERGFTEREGYSGRKITELGKLELERGLAYDQVDFIFSKFDEMIYQANFNQSTKTGNVIVNSSTFLKEDKNEIIQIIKEVFQDGLAVSPFVELRKKKFDEREDVSIKTICATTIDGIFLKNGIPSLLSYGGLLKIKDNIPQKFTELISYKGTSITPLDAFIADEMTSVIDVVKNGSGIIPANFRVIPSKSDERAKKLLKKLANVGINGVISIGKDGEKVLGVPVPNGSIGIAIIGGVTPLCAAKEVGHNINIKLSESVAEFEGMKHIFSKKHSLFNNNLLKSSLKKPKNQKITFLLNKAYNFLQNVDFNIETHEGKLISNVSYINKRDLDESIEIMKNAYKKSKNYICPYYKVINDLNDVNIKENQVGIATVCSLSVDGVLINNGVMSIPKYGGLLEIGNKPLFLELISYNGSSLDPHEIFIFKNMVSINKNETKKILASLKEIPVIARKQSKEILDEISKIGFPIYKIGKPREIIYNAKVHSYNCGIVAGSGLNSIAAIKEEGIDVKVKAVQGTITLDEMEIM